MKIILTLLTIIAYIVIINTIDEILGRTYWVGYFNGSFDAGLFIYLLWKVGFYE